MFLRRNRRTVDGECYEYWTLVKTVRTAKGPRQEVVASLGKAPGLDSKTRDGWDQLAALLEGRTPGPIQSVRSIWRWRCGGAWDCINCSKR
jgi:hypothetical protein